MCCVLGPRPHMAVDEAKIVMKDEIELHLDHAI
jgi:hypothetical protein